MEFNELVKVRRSCRNFKESTVSEEDIKKIIETTLLAPSWKNSETGRYYLALSKEAIEVVYESLPDFNKKSTKGAVYIVTTFKKGISGHGDDNWGAYDLGQQNAYLILKAKNLGYDTLILGLRDEEKLREYFNIPDDEIMLPVIAIGQSNTNLTLNKRKEVNEVLIIK